MDGALSLLVQGCSRGRLPAHRRAARGRFSFAEEVLGMPYLADTIVMAQEAFGRLENFQPDALLERLGEASTIGEGAEALGLIDVLPAEQRDPMRSFLASIPPAVDAGMMAAVRSALGRGLRVQISWQPGYDFELRVWDVSEGTHGMVNVHLTSPHPVEATPRTT